MKLFKTFSLFIFIVIILHLSAIKAYPGWFKHYGGTVNDGAYSIQQTSDGGYILSGYTMSYTYGGEDFAIYKLDSSGNKVWFKHYGGTSHDYSYSIQQTSDGGYIVTGYTGSYTNGGWDFGIYKLNSIGNKMWFKHYGGSGNDTPREIQQTSDGGYIVAGYSYSYTHGSADIAIYKLNSSGNKVWFKHYGGAQGDFGLSIQQTSDGGYIVGGYTSSYSHGDTDFSIYRLNSSGNKVWFKHYGGSNRDSGYSIQQTSDGGYIVSGYTGSYTNGGWDFAIYKLNSSGNKVWYKHYGGTSNDFTYSIRQTSDGGYIVGGSTYSFSHGEYDFGIYKLDSSGGKIWFKHYGGSEDDNSEAIQQTSDGGYIVAGETESFSHGGDDFAIYKLNSAGNK